MLQKKKENQGVLSRKEIATLLGKNKEELARIRVEQIIRDDYVVEVLEILELYCTLLTSRFGLIEVRPTRTRAQPWLKMIIAALFLFPPPPFLLPPPPRGVRLSSFIFMFV